MAEQIFLASAPAPDLESDIREKWQDHALCTQVSPHIFFPRRGESTLDAKLICVGCPVSLTCLKYQLDFENDPTVNGRYGIFGGLSERERRKIDKIMKEKPLTTLEAARDEVVGMRKHLGNRKQNKPVKPSQELQAL